MAVEFCCLDQAHDRGSALAGELRTREEPVPATSGPGSNLPLIMIVVDGQHRIAEKARQRGPSIQAVVDGLGDGGAIVYAASRGEKPGVQVFSDRY